MKFAAAVAASEAVVKAADAESYNPAAANELAAEAALDARLACVAACEAAELAATDALDASVA